MISRHLCVECDQISGVAARFDDEYYRQLRGGAVLQRTALGALDRTIQDFKSVQSEHRGRELSHKRPEIARWGRRSHSGRREKRVAAGRAGGRSGATGPQPGATGPQPNRRMKNVRLREAASPTKIWTLERCIPLNCLFL